MSNAIAAAVTALVAAPVAAVKEEKLWTVAGYSDHPKHGRKLRTSQGKAKARGYMLKANGHYNVELHDLPVAMTKADAEKWLQTRAAGLAAQAAAATDTATQADTAESDVLPSIVPDLAVQITPPAEAETATEEVAAETATEEVAAE